MKRWLTLLLVLVLCLLLCACGSAATPTEAPAEAPTEAPTEPPEPTVSPEELARREAYHEKMAAGLANIDPTRITNFKAIVAVREYLGYKNGSAKYGEVTYTDSYIDPEWAAAEPEEVRFVVQWTCGVSEKGFYTHGGKAYQHYISVEITDLVTGGVCGKAVFSGSEPPETVKEPGDHYGSEVDAAEIQEWSTSVINAEVVELARGALEAIKEITDKVDGPSLMVPSRSEVQAELQKTGDFSDEIIEYALGCCGVDWNEFARMHGEAFVESYEEGCKPARFEKGLTDCGFTEEEIAYAAQSIDWNAQAVKLVPLDMVDIWRMTEGQKKAEEKLIARLIEYGFTQEQAEYAVEQTFS